MERDNPTFPRRQALIKGASVAGGVIVVAVVASLNRPGVASAAGFEEMWRPDLNSFYPGDEGMARSLGMRMITAPDSGLAFLDRASEVIAREIYGVEVKYNNLGFWRRFQRLNINQSNRSSFGLCSQRAAWAVRDEWPFRQPREQLFEIPHLYAPSIREMAEIQIFGYGPIAIYYHSDNEAENLRYFRDRFLEEPDNVGNGFMVDIPFDQSGTWWGHVSRVERRSDGYWYRVGRAGQYYQWYHERVIRYSAEPVDNSDLDNPPPEKPGLILLRVVEDYRSPYYDSKIVRAINYGEPLPSPEQFKTPPFIEDKTLAA